MAGSNVPLLIPPTLVEILQQEAPIAEKEGRLTDTQLQIIYSENWFKLFVPQQYGGLQLSLPEGLLAEEAFARIDGSLGWTITLCAGATFFVGYLQPSLSNVLFKNSDVCFGGSGATGIAVKNGTRYTVNGYWKYATGSPHNTAFTVNCTIEETGKPLTNSDGSPAILSFIFLRDEVKIDTTWQMMGLQATASHSFEVNNLVVDENRTFLIAPEAATLSLPIFQYPFLPFAEATLAANMLGMAEHFLEESGLILLHHSNQKTSALAAAAWQPQNERLQNQRTLFYNVVEQSWRHHIQNGSITIELQNEVGRASLQLAATALAVVDAVYPFCGMSAAKEESVINCIWRDIHTASQHSLLSPARYNL